MIRKKRQLQGTEIRLGPRIFILPKVSMETALRVTEVYAKMPEKPRPDEVAAAAIDAITIALQPGYPRLTRRDIERIATPENFDDMAAAVREISTQGKKAFDLFFELQRATPQLMH